MIKPIETETIPVEVEFKKRDGSIVKVKATKVIRKRIASKKVLKAYFKESSLKKLKSIIKKQINKTKSIEELSFFTEHFGIMLRRRVRDSQSKPEANK